MLAASWHARVVVPEPEEDNGYPVTPEERVSGAVANDWDAAEADDAASPRVASHVIPRVDRQ
jgi:hypothetical protein